MIRGLTIGRRGSPYARAEKRSTSLELLGFHGAVEVVRQGIEAGKLSYLLSAEDWKGFEFIYILSGVLAVRDGEEEILLGGGDYLSHHGLPERVYFRVVEPVELLLVNSPRSFSEMRGELEEMMALTRSVEEKDSATEEHGRRIEQLALRTGERLGLSNDQLITLSYSAYLHDVGKVHVPDSVLGKEGALSAEERAEIQKHPSYGAEVLHNRGFLDEAARIVLSHQERYDGAGYPRGLRGAEIPIEARIIAAVDAYDAMSSDRPYRASLPREEVEEELRKASGSQLDPSVVQALLDVLREEGGRVG